LRSTFKCNDSPLPANDLRAVGYTAARKSLAYKVRIRP